MTRKIYRPMLAFALALGLLATVANPGHAALSTSERPAVAEAQAPVSAELAAAAATPALAPTAPVTAAAPVTTATAPVAQQPAKAVAPKLKPRQLASAPRRGYPCH